MESGRRTPVALTRPLSGHFILPEIRVQDTTLGSGQQEQSPAHEAEVCPPSPQDPSDENIRHTRSQARPVERTGTEDFISCYLFFSVVDTWLGDRALFRSTIAAALALSWVVYSEAFGMDLPTLTGSVHAPQHGVGEESPSILCMRSSEYMKLSNRPANLLHHPLTIKTSQSCTIERSQERLPSPFIVTSPIELTSPIQVIFPRSPQSNSEARIKEHAFETHALLRKHYKFLLPWVSKQPETPVEERDADSIGAASEIRMADEFRRMSMSHFADLSTAVYCDVRRRDEQASPASPQPPRAEPWMRNKQNESRMVLCRTTNGQYHRLVMAVVLEQARRLAEIRIRIHRRSLIARR